MSVILGVDNEWVMVNGKGHFTLRSVIHQYINTLIVASYPVQLFLGTLIEEDLLDTGPNTPAGKASEVSLPRTQRPKRTEWGI